jgi:glycosyltransferase involved in cell wall biosynthesis
MRIALATWFPADPSAPHGGVEAVSVNLTRALARIAGNEVQVVTFDEGLSVPQRYEWAGATIHRLPRVSGSLLGFSCGEGRRRLGEFLQDLRPDVVHAHDTYGIMTRGLNLPRVFTIHGFIHEDTRLKGGWKNRLRSELWKQEELATWAEQPHIISISPYVRERLRGIARGVIHDIENPIDSACFDITRNEEPGRIFSAAVICRRKNPQALVDAVACLGVEFETKLVLAGPIGEADYGEALKKSIQDLGLPGRVELPGSLSGLEVREELAKAAVFSLCSFEEGAPMGIAEAMAAGIPILTSNRCGMPYMVRHGESGFLVDPLRPDEIAARLRELLENPELRQRMALAAKGFAKERFHPHRVAERTLGVYCNAKEMQKNVKNSKESKFRLDKATYF